MTKAGPVQHPPRRLSALGTAGGGAHAHTRGTKPCEPTLRPAAPAAQLPGCTLTLHLHSAQTHGHTGTLRGRRAGPRYPEVHTRVHTRVHTPRPRGHNAAPAAQTPCTPAARSHCLPCLHADASERDGRWTRGGTIPGGAQEGEVAPRPDGLLLRALPGSPVRTPSRGRPPALTVGPAAAEAAAAARAPARPRRCRLGRGGGSGSRGGAGGRRGWDPLPPPEAPLLPRLTPPTPRPRCRRRPPQPLTCGSSVP